MELKNTYIYHSIKPIIFAILTVVSAIVSYVLWEYTSSIQKAMLIISMTITCIFSIMFFISLGMLASVALYDLNYQAHQYDVQRFPFYCVTFEGAPGAGKTDTMKREAIIRAEHNYAMLREEYFLGYHQLPKWLDENNEYRLGRWHEVKNVYEFYIQHPEIFPCLVSNVSMKVDGREVMKFEFAHLVQEANLGYRSVAIIDEARDSGVTNEDSRNLPREMDEIFRFCRQFYEATIYCTEQNKARIVLALRCVSINFTMESLKKGILRPIMLEKLYHRRFDKLYKKYGDKMYVLYPKKKYKLIYGFKYFNLTQFSIAQLKKMRPSSPSYVLSRYFEQKYKQVHKLNKLKDLIDSIGFVKYSRKVSGGTQGNVTVTQSADQLDRSQQLEARTQSCYHESFYMPALRRYVSDTRMFAKLNLAYDLPFKPYTWGNQVYVDRQYWDKQLQYRATFNSLRK